jgi:hypothetical protein
MTKYLRNQPMKRKGLFWLTVAEVSDHGCLTLIFRACGCTVHAGTCSRKQAYSSYGGQEARRRRGWGPKIPFKGTSLMT